GIRDDLVTGVQTCALPISVQTLNGVNQKIQASAVAIDRLFEILNHPEEADAEKGVELSNVQGHITMEHVNFSYVPEIEVLHNVKIGRASCRESGKIFV